MKSEYLRKFLWAGSLPEKTSRAVCACSPLRTQATSPALAFLLKEDCSRRDESLMAEPLEQRAVSERAWYSELLLRRTPIYSRLRSVVGLLAVVVLAIVASPHAPRGGLVFLQSGNITDILRQVSEIGIIS